MNTYDPMDRIVYRHLDTRHLDTRRDSTPTPVTTTAAITPLPAGYANGSPRTYLGRTRRAAQAA